VSTHGHAWHRWPPLHAVTNRARSIISSKVLSLRLGGQRWTASVRSPEAAGAASHAMSMIEAARSLPLGLLEMIERVVVQSADPA
jgi:hypothetical protein